MNLWRLRYTTRMTELKLAQLTDHFYWLAPGPPDRPTLGAVVGERGTLLLDAGASAVHARLFLDALAAANLPAPLYVALTHWHWDHVFGAEALGLPVIAHALTAQQLATLATYAWDDAAMDARVQTGEETASSAENIKLELPAPRSVRIIQPTFTFTDSLKIDLGGVTCTLQHVGGEHATDSVVAYIEPDRVLFLGDCLYPVIYGAPTWQYTRQTVLPLLDKVSGFDAQHYLEGHGAGLISQAEFARLTGQMRLVADLVVAHGADEAAILAAAERAGQPRDEDLLDFVHAFIAGIPK
ncbi:MAG: MBL fold metallo-hydrolase [Anaerolineae bacterium]|nr:MBL fold metallo-hydrolase [Anaerolineae bacterium]